MGFKGILPQLARRLEGLMVRLLLQAARRLSPGGRVALLLGVNRLVDWDLAREGGYEG